MVILSIIIPTYNEEQYIKKNIHTMMRLNFNKDELEIIYVDGMSSDSTPSIIRRYAEENPQIKLYNNPKRKTPFAINIGVKNAQGKYVLIVGAHSALEAGYAKNLVKHIEKLDADAVGGVIVTDVQNKTKKSVAIKKTLSNPFGIGNAEYRINLENTEVREVDTAGFLCYNRQKLIDIGLYNEKLFRNQDIELNRRIKNHGGKIYLVPTAKVVYFARESYKELAKNNFANGLWNILTVYYTKDFKSLCLRHFIPLIFLLSLLIPTILSFFWLPFIIISGCSFLSYNLLIIYQAIKMNDKETNIWSIIKAFYTLHFSYGMGSLIGTFKVLKLKLFGE